MPIEQMLPSACRSSATVSADGRWLWLSVGDGCEPTNKAYVCDLHKLQTCSEAQGGGVAWDAVAYDASSKEPRLPFVKLADDFSASWSLVAVDGSTLTIQTNFRSPRERLVAVDMDTAQDGDLTKGNFREVLPQHKKDLLQGATPLQGDLMVVQWMRDVVDVAEVRRISDGALLAPVPLPSLGTMSGAITEPNRASTEFWFTMTSFLEPSAKYRCDAAQLVSTASGKLAESGNGVASPTSSGSDGSSEVKLFSRTQLKVAHNPGDYITKQVRTKPQVLQPATHSCWTSCCKGHLTRHLADCQSALPP